MNSKFLLHAALSSMFIAGVLQAEAVLTFEEMDVNSNGAISPNEAQASKAIADNFKMIDSNNNGSINITEFQQFMGKGRMSPPEEMETSEPGAAPY